MQNDDLKQLGGGAYLYQIDNENLKIRASWYVKKHNTISHSLGVVYSLVYDFDGRISDIADIFHCSISTAYRIFDRADVHFKIMTEKKRQLLVQVKSYLLNNTQYIYSDAAEKRKNDLRRMGGSTPSD